MISLIVLYYSLKRISSAHWAGCLSLALDECTVSGARMRYCVQVMTRSDRDNTGHLTLTKVDLDINIAYPH